MKGVFARPVAVLAVLAAGVSVAHAAPAQTADLSAFITAQAVAPATQAQQELDDLTAQRVSRYGRIVNARPVGLGGLTAWTVEKKRPSGGVVQHPGFCGAVHRCGLEC